MIVVSIELPESRCKLTNQDKGNEIIFYTFNNVSLWPQVLPLIIYVYYN